MDAPQAVPRLRPLASMTELTVKPSGILCRKIAKKMSHPSQFDTRNPDAIAIPSKKRVNDQSQQDRISGVRMTELVMVRFFAKVKMWRYRVLEEVNDEIAK